MKNSHITHIIRTMPMSTIDNLHHLKKCFTGILAVMGVTSLGFMDVIVFVFTSINSFH